MGYRKMLGYCSLSLSLTEALDAWNHPEFLFSLEPAFTVGLGNYPGFDFIFVMCNWAVLMLFAELIVWCYPVFPGACFTAGLENIMGFGFILWGVIGCVAALYWAHSLILSCFTGAWFTAGLGNNVGFVFIFVMYTWFVLLLFSEPIVWFCLILPSACFIAGFLGK